MQELSFLTCAIQAAQPDLTEEQAQSFLDAAIAKASEEHSDFERFAPAIGFLATAVFTDFARVPLSDFLEILYSAAKHADFTRPWRKAIGKKPR